jgi:AAA ATPase domain
MALLRMTLSNYRCFAEGFDVALRPLTIVLGKNNSGKSALVRAPVLINTGIRTDSPAPLDLDMLDENMLQSFTDLIYGNRPHGNIAIKLWFDTDQGDTQVDVTVQNIDEYQQQVVTSLRIDSGSKTASIEWVPSDPPDSIVYNIEFEGRSYSNVTVDFSGLLPTGDLGPDIAQELTLFLYRVTAAIRASFPTIRYFGPFRDQPRRIYRLPARMPADLGVSGEYAAQALASDFARQQGKLLREVNELFRNELFGWKVDVVERAGMYAVVLNFGTDESLTINLVDVGTGVAQVLPILVQRGVDALNPPQGPILEIVEQPELHLHPAAHGALADLYIAAAKQRNMRFVVETHSETFLLRVRRRVAEGSLDPNLLSVYFLESVGGVATAMPIAIGPDGTVAYWPAGVFSEDYEEAKALTQAQSARAER